MSWNGSNIDVVSSDWEIIVCIGSDWSAFFAPRITHPANFLAAVIPTRSCRDTSCQCFQLNNLTITQWFVGLELKLQLWTFHFLWGQTVCCALRIRHGTCHWIALKACWCDFNAWNSSQRVLIICYFLTSIPLLFLGVIFHIDAQQAWKTNTYT